MIGNEIEKESNYILKAIIYGLDKNLRNLNTDWRSFYVFKLAMKLFQVLSWDLFAFIFSVLHPYPLS